MMFKFQVDMVLDNIPNSHAYPYRRIYAYRSAHASTKGPPNAELDT
jgi:hypothetical protein